MNHALLDVTRFFLTRDSYLDWVRDNPAVQDPAFIQRFADHAVEHGVASDWFGGTIPPAEVRIATPNLRESLLARGFNPRQRAVLDLVAALPQANPAAAARIYAPEALTPLALELRHRFPRFLGSEYVGDPERRKVLFPIRHEDAQQLSFPDGSFDMYVSCEVLEHVPSIDVALREAARILRPAGVMLGTVPFHAAADEGVVKARLVGGAVELLAPPEHHGNPAEPEQGSLVFEIPGWNLLRRARAAGFRDARMLYRSSLRHGICATDLAGVLIFLFTK